MTAVPQQDGLVRTLCPEHARLIARLLAETS